MSGDSRTTTDAAPQARRLSPRRNTTAASNVPELVAEQLAHFGIDGQSEFGATLARIAQRLYENYADIDRLWQITLESIATLDRADRIAYFNAKKFLSFQFAKLLDMLPGALAADLPGLDYSSTTQYAKGPYALFDNVTAIFAANPVIARTATYVYACAEWIADAFQGKELLLEIYSRLLNPTSVSLANYIVDLEAGPYARRVFRLELQQRHGGHRRGAGASAGNGRHPDHQPQYLRRCTPIDSRLVRQAGQSGHRRRHLRRLRRRRLSQLLAARRARVRRALAGRTEGLRVSRIALQPARIRARRAGDLSRGARARVCASCSMRPSGRRFSAGPCSAAIRRSGPTSSSTATRRTFPAPARWSPAWSSAATKTCSSPRENRSAGVAWNDTLFWNVYYVKGAFLNADAAFEVLQGIRTLENRMLAKCINTQILARFLDAHPGINVHCNELAHDENSALRERLLFLGLPAPLFTIDFEAADIPREAFQRFFDNLAPTFGHMISLGQSNTIVSCPALTTHSELPEDELRRAGISPTTIRFAVGDEDPKDLIDHLVATARFTIDPVASGFSAQFPSASATETLIKDCYVDAHRRYVESKFAR